MPHPEIQSAGFLLELSPDWLIVRASENAHRFLSEYHQRLVGNPLAEFTLAQPLHDLRNSLARQRSSSGIARAYRVRLFDDPRHFDIAFQTTGATILLEGQPSRDEGVGDCLGSVSRLIDGLGGADPQARMDNAARRMRALTGFDRVTLTMGDRRSVSSRSEIPEMTIDGELPAIVADAESKPVALYPKKDQDGVDGALLRSPSAEQSEQLGRAGIRSALCVPVVRQGKTIGRFECDNRAPAAPAFELHAAAELFAQVFGMQEG